MAAYFLKPKTGHKPPKPFEGRYRRLLDWALRNRWKSAGFGALFFFGSIGIASLLPTAFLPEENLDFVYLQVEGPPGATRDDMETIVQEATTLLRRNPATHNVFAQIGSTASFGFGQLAAAGCGTGPSPSCFTKIGPSPTRNIRRRSGRCFGGSPTRGSRPRAGSARQTSRSSLQARMAISSSSLPSGCSAKCAGWP
jgi:multidrug efflux pump subunit AcrB